MSSSSYAELKETRNDEELVMSQEEDEYNVGKPAASSFEADQDFKFKRHKNKQSNGVPSLGERLDNLQDIKKAKWVDNFNSSMPNARETTGNNGLSSPRVPAGGQAYPSSQPVPPYMPYMYYYPMPPQGPPMMPYMGSPVHPTQVDGQQYMNSSVSMMPNSSLQPFFPPGQQPRYDQEAPQLMPAPSLYPYNYVQSQQQYAKKAKDRRKSIAQNRGRRLSILASQDDGNGIVSPHKDVPEKDFYRHIGDTSFGKSLQMRQLFSWCIIRSLKKLEEKEMESKQTARTESRDYADPKKMALVIMKEFVNDLRRGNIDVDWEAEEAADGDEDNDETGEDTELRELFDDNDDDDGAGTGNTRTVRRKKHQSNIADRPKIPNSKNVENEKNLEVLEGLVRNLKEEVDSWAQVLGKQNPEAEWQTIDRQFSLPDKKLETANDDLPVAHISQDLTRRLDRLQVHSHLLNSSSEALSVLLGARRDKLSRSFAATVRDTGRQIDPKCILKSLSESLTER